MEEKIIKEKSALKEWIAWAKKGNWSIPGYRIVEAPKGPKLGETTTERYMIVERPHGVTYQHSLGLVSRFSRGCWTRSSGGPSAPSAGPPTARRGPTAGNRSARWRRLSGGGSP